METSTKKFCLLQCGQVLCNVFVFLNNIPMTNLSKQRVFSWRDKILLILQEVKLCCWKNVSDVLYLRRETMQRPRRSDNAKTFPKRDSHYYGKEAVVFAGLLVHHPRVGWKWLLCVRWSLSGGSMIHAKPPAVISGHHLITQCLPSSNTRREWATQVVNSFARM